MITSEPINAIFNPDLFNPVFWHVWEALHNPKIRRILIRGGSSGGKTFSVCDVLNLYQLQELRNVFALRKHRVHVASTIKPSFEASINRLEGLDQYFTKMEGEIRVATGALTMYSGMDDPEKVKGLEGFDIVFINELNQFLETEWNEVNRRLRGRPNQKIIADWNPISAGHWINTEVLPDTEGWTELPLNLPEFDALGAITQLTPGYAFKKINAAGDTLWINVTYRDNFWIVGHPTDPSIGFKDDHTVANFEKMKRTKPNDYRIYGLGLDGIIRTGGEAWTSFDFDKHSREGLDYDPAYPIHLTLDSNVLPYVTVLAWQIVPVAGDLMEIRQIAELPCRPPKNNAVKAAIAVDLWIRSLQHTDANGKPVPDMVHPLYIYGDPSANARNTVDEEGRSFFAKFKGSLEVCGYKLVDRVAKSAPGVSISVDFINDIYAELIGEWRIVINSLCNVSLEDYALVKQDANGAILKVREKDKVTLQSFEKYGHCTDAKRYFITTILADLFTTYKQRTGQPRVMAVNE